MSFANWPASQPLPPLLLTQLLFYVLRPDPCSLFFLSSPCNRN